MRCVMPQADWDQPFGTCEDPDLQLSTERRRRLPTGRRSAKPEHEIEKGIHRPATRRGNASTMRWTPGQTSFLSGARRVFFSD